MEYSPDFLAVNKALLGKPIDGVPVEKLDLQESMLHSLNMGYSQLGKITPHTSILYHKEENEYSHPWSIEAIGRRYGFAKLHEYMPLNDYLTLPSHLVENLLVGITKGAQERAEIDRKNNEPPTITKEEKELAEMMKRMEANKS